MSNHDPASDVSATGSIPTAGAVSRVPSGTPNGGRFAAVEHAEAPVALEIEFAPDEAAEVDRALEGHSTHIASGALADGDLVWGEQAQREYAANQSARAALSGIRAHLGDHSGGQQFARKIFSAEEVSAMTDALNFHVAHAREQRDRGQRVDAATVDAAQFRISIAEPLHRESDEEPYEPPETSANPDHDLDHDPGSGAPR